ncbi:hypothetical protein CJ19_051 [Escherichia phage CJ19]|nr:hypothetical protein CJ19_051 [Escherichia phage CJ19]
MGASRPVRLLEQIKGITRSWRNCREELLMIILCIVLYILGALPVYAIAKDVSNSDNNWYDMVIVAAIWPIAIALGVVKGAYKKLKEQ